MKPVGLIFSLTLHLCEMFVLQYCNGGDFGQFLHGEHFVIMW